MVATTNTILHDPHVTPRRDLPFSNGEKSTRPDGGCQSFLTLMVCLFPRQILTREFEDSLQSHEHCFAVCDGLLRITVRLHPRYQIDLLGHPPFAFGDMDLSL